jgi:multimeric flavodoxin WrbA
MRYTFTMDDQVTVAIAFHSGGGQTARLAESVGLGVCGVSGVTAVPIRVDELTEAGWDRLDAADAIIFGAPTYMGSASAAFHAFAQASSCRWHTQSWQDKFAAGFTTSKSPNGDKASTLHYFATLAAQHGMIWVNLGLPVRGDVAGGQAANRLGFFTGAAAQSNGQPEPDPADLATAEHLGRRVARYALLAVAGRVAMLTREAASLPSGTR